VEGVSTLSTPELVFLKEKKNSNFNLFYWLTHGLATVNCQYNCQYSLTLSRCYRPCNVDMCKAPTSLKSCSICGTSSLDPESEPSLIDLQTTTVTISLMWFNTGEPHHRHLNRVRGFRPGTAVHNLLVIGDYIYIGSERRYARVIR